MYKKIEGTKLEINEYGVVRNINTKYQYKSHIASDGYAMLGNISDLFQKSRLVHKLVYFTHNNIAFDSEFNNTIRYQIDHIDRDKTNNHLSNLRLVSVSSNALNKTNYSIKLFYNLETEDTIITDNIMEFARLYNLDNGALYKVIKNCKLSHNKWIGKEIEIECTLNDFNFVKVFNIDNDELMKNEIKNMKDAFHDNKKNIDKGFRYSDDLEILSTNIKSSETYQFKYGDRTAFCKEHGLEKRRISEVLRGLRKTHKGFKFEIANKHI